MAAGCLLLFVTATFLADGQHDGQHQRHVELEQTGIDADGVAPHQRDHWFASGVGSDEARKPPTWRDVIVSNYPAEPQYDPPSAELYRQNPEDFTRRFRVVRPGAGSTMLSAGPDAPNAVDQAKDRWYMAGQYDDHKREMHGHIPELAKYVQAGYPSDYKSPSSFPMGDPEYAAPRRMQALRMNQWKLDLTSPRLQAAEQSKYDQQKIARYNLGEEVKEWDPTTWHNVVGARPARMQARPTLLPH